MPYNNKKVLNQVVKGKKISNLLVQLAQNDVIDTTKNNTMEAEFFYYTIFSVCYCCKRFAEYYQSGVCEKLSPPTDNLDNSLQFSHCLEVLCSACCNTDVLLYIQAV